MLEVRAPLSYMMDQVDHRDATWLSVAWFPSGRSLVWTASCPARFGNAAGRAGSLRVDQELHAADSGDTRRRPGARAPNSSAARMSSRSRTG